MLRRVYNNAQKAFDSTMVRAGDTSACMQELNHVVRLLTVTAAVLAVPLALACCLVPLHLPYLLTSDAAVVAALRPLAPTAGAAILLCTMDTACEGVLVAQGRVRMLIAGMSAIAVALGLYFWAGNGTTAIGTWRGLLLFFCMRVVLTGAGVAQGMMRGRQSHLGKTTTAPGYA